MDQPKLERLLRLMKTAHGQHRHTTIDHLAERLMMSRRTVYRYIDTFREAGFVIKKSGELHPARQGVAALPATSRS